MSDLVHQAQSGLVGREVVLPNARGQELARVTRLTGHLNVERQIGVVRRETACAVQDGLLLVCELSDALVIVPAQDLTDSLNATQFKRDLLRHAGKKPYLVIELNQQGALPSDAIIWALLDLHKACGTQSKIIVTTRDRAARAKFTEMTEDRLWTTVESGVAALELIDLENFLRQRDSAHIGGASNRQ